VSAALVLALFFTVALLATSAYFLMGSLPLLVLEHDTPLDARFVRGFFNAYYLGATVTASACALSYAFAGWLAFAAGAAVLAISAVALWRLVIPKMDRLRARLQSEDAGAVSSFRRLHVTAIAFSLAQLVLTVGSLIAVSIRMK